MLLVFPAVISLDLIRRRRSRVDLFCCFTWFVLTNSAFYPSGVGKWVPALAGKAKACMVYSVSGCTRVCR